MKWARCRKSMTIGINWLTLNVYIISDDFLQKESNLNSTQSQMEYLPYENKQYNITITSGFVGIRSL